MHFGGIAEEHIQLNEGTLWAGGPHNYDHPGALAALPENRKLIFEGKYHDAQVIADREVMSQPLGQAPYQTVGDLFVKFDFTKMAAGNIDESLTLTQPSARSLIRAETLLTPANSLPLIPTAF